MKIREADTAYGVCSFTLQLQLTVIVFWVSGWEGGMEWETPPPFKKKKSDQSAKQKDTETPLKNKTTTLVKSGFSSVSKSVHLCCPLKND